MNNFLNKNISKILTFFIIINPILDLISGLNNHYFNLPININQIVRILFLICGTIYLLFICKNKKNYIYLLLFFIYFILFGFNIYFTKGSDILFYELKNSLLFFYFPLSLLIFYNLFKEYDVKIDIKYLYYTLFIYLIFISIPNLFNIGFSSYLEGKKGCSGWFNSANAVSSIISILTPFILIYFKNNKINLLFILLFLYSILTLGTKVPLMSLVIVIFFNLIYLIYKLFLNNDIKKIFISLITTAILIILSIILIPKTTFYENIKIHLNYLGVEKPIQIITDIDVIDRFIFSDRLSFLSNTKSNYDNSSISSKLLGIGYIENYSSDNVSTKMIEIDYYDIFYRHGLIGFIIFFTPVLVITYKIIKKANINNFNSLNKFISILLIYLLSLFSGHILTVPNVSIFVTLILCTTLFKDSLYLD